MEKISLTLIRHGATGFNLEHRYLSRTDEGLAEEGVRALLLRKEVYNSLSPGRLYSGPMLRCRQTAEILFPGRECHLVPEWTEMDFGSFEGKNYRELNKDAAYQSWIDSGGTAPFPEGEGQPEFIARTMRGFYNMLSEMGAAEIVAVVHGGTIMALVSTIFGGNYFDYQVENGEGFRCCFLCQDRARIMEIRTAGIRPVELRRI